MKYIAPFESRVKLAAVFLFALGLLLMVSGTAAANNDDFVLSIIVNGEDVTDAGTITVDPDEPLNVELRFTRVRVDTWLQELHVELTFTEQTIFRQARTLEGAKILAREDYIREISLDPGEFLKAGDFNLASGIYGGRFRLVYFASGEVREWRSEKNIRIPGNPITTPAGMVGAATTLAALASFTLMGSTLAAPAIAAGTVLPAGASLTGTPGLQDLIMKRLEATARGRVVGNVVKAAKSRIVKGKCPICESRIKHGQCFTCKKSAKEVGNEYTEKIQELVMAGGKLIAEGQARTLGEMTTQLDISGKLGTDVIAAMKHAKLVKVGGLARKLMGKAITAGISSGISAIIWVTVGGLAVLSAWALIGILAAAVILPIVITKTLQARAKRQLKRSATQ